MIIQSNPHGLPMPPKSTALLVVAVVALLWALGLFAMDLLAAAVVVGGVALVCTLSGFVMRSRARRPY